MPKEYLFDNVQHYTDAERKARLAYAQHLIERAEQKRLEELLFPLKRRRLSQSGE